MLFPHYSLAELHAHLGASISTATLWQIAHDLGVRLPKKEYNDFRHYVTLSEDRKMSLADYEKKIYHPVLDKLSSGTHAVEQATYHILSNAYRNKGVSLFELRNNPMRHNRNAEFDLDHIIMAMLRGMERALLEYRGLSAGLILCMARLFNYEQNAIIVEKAIKYHRRGVIGIDVADSSNPAFHMKDYQQLFKKAKQAGLKVTVHSGEAEDTDDMWEVLEYIKPDRIGHGIRAARDPELMKELAHRKVVLEICPMSNLVTGALTDIEALKTALHKLIEYEVLFCINTDWPEMIQQGGLRRQYQMLRDNNILSEADLERCNKTAWEVSFIPKKRGLAAYL